MPPSENYIVAKLPWIEKSAGYARLDELEPYYRCYPDMLRLVAPRNGLGIDELAKWMGQELTLHVNNKPRQMRIYDVQVSNFTSVFVRGDAEVLLEPVRRV